MKKKSSNIITLIIYVLLIATIIFAIASLFSKNTTEESFDYGDMIKCFEDNIVRSYTFDENTYEIILTLYTDDPNVTQTKSYVLSSHDYFQFFSPYSPSEGDLARIQRELGEGSKLLTNEVVTSPAKETPWFVSYIPSIILVVLFIIFRNKLMGNLTIGGVKE